MKTKYLILILFLLSIRTYGEKPVSDSIGLSVTEVEVHLVHWNAKRPFAFSTENFQKYSTHHFFFDGSDFYTFFTDYLDFNENLANYPKTDSAMYIVGMAIIKFNNDKNITLFFDHIGNYNFDGKWHQVNYELYYTLFKYFSNELVSSKTLDLSREKYQGDFWYPKK